MTFQLTKEEKSREILACAKDPLYFINKYVYISHPLRGRVPFKTFDFQEDVIKDFLSFRFSIIIKARQLGISTVIAAYAAWLMMFHREKNILVVATKEKTAANIVKKVKAMLKNIPVWLRISEIATDNTTSFGLKNGSIITAESTSYDVGRSEAVSLLILDEAAYIEGLEDLWNGLYSTLSTGGQCVVASTPAGTGNWFHKTYEDSLAARNDFHYIKLPWTVHPERDQAWYEKETRNMSPRQIASELLCSFRMSGETVIDPQYIERLREAIKEPIERTGFDRNLWIWEEYKQTEKGYLIVADSSRGDATDYSVCHVIKPASMEVVAEYQGKLEPDAFADFLMKLGYAYGGAIIVVENNGLGYSVVTKMINAKYPNVYYSKKTSHEYVDPIEAEMTNAITPGFSMTPKTRPLVIGKLEELIRNNILKIYSERFVGELATFIWKNGRPEAMKGYNDDLSMSLAIACWVRDTVIIGNQRTAEYTKAILNAMSFTRVEISTKIAGQNGYKRDKNHYKEQARTLYPSPFYCG